MSTPRDSNTDMIFSNSGNSEFLIRLIPRSELSFLVLFLFFFALYAKTVIRNFSLTHEIMLVMKIPILNSELSFALHGKTTIQNFSKSTKAFNLKNVVQVCLVSSRGVNLHMSRCGMCHYFGYFFWVAPGFLGTFLGYSRIFGYHFLVKFDFFKNNPDFWYWFWYFIDGIVECCLQGSCFLFSSVRFNPFLQKRMAIIKE